MTKLIKIEEGIWVNPNNITELSPCGECSTIISYLGYIAWDKEELGTEVRIHSRIIEDLTPDEVAEIINRSDDNDTK